MSVAWAMIAFAAFAVLYAYALYPLSLVILARSRRPRRGQAADNWTWPAISITIPVYNEVHQIDDLIESLLRIDYPQDRLQILFVSDASDDGTDERIRAYAHRGIELLRMPQRGGKTAGENAARTVLRGEIVVNTDASIRIAPEAVKALIEKFRDPEVGLASGRDVSVTRVEGELNVGESSYVGYEMWIRSLETDLHGIVGASGCFYAIRSNLHQEVVPSALSRDFASAMITRQHGYRPVTVNEAICYVPRVPSLKREYRRKVRTITRGMETLYFKRALLNPFRFGIFSWMLFSHKITRWFAPWAALVGGVGLAILATSQPIALFALGALALLGLLALVGWRWPEGRTIPRMFSMPAFLVAGNVAVLHATLKALTGELNAVWEPTRREPGQQQTAPATSV